ncbi:50S ribosomal protein L29 [Desulfovibrio sp. OttesenSCG-928-I05]|nr:50S ribosomal protein L29 [Desulfovibrio sp. OttesenSCG-928-I05]
MKVKESRKALEGLDEAQLKTKLAEARADLFNLRFKHATGQLEKSAELPAARREVARILTYLTKKGA